ncbi:copper resistance CopC family protein [Mycobacterium colombiense]|uniref:Copper resistance protein CopC n=1 Tax=Mycobacterium colombiense TaxID=339268 RepID=A0A853M151_9MYCO|nr:copper resistance CopC family protein [Mycobacterium colombiense]OBJ13264.1 copper resistance protein CopC [Mycobacterium colombiense]OBJ61119.1 copper resistance protein CopC [Mycobacterium colombiense]OBJ67656.1 copper resistance protein CopC [Mycobacterium colombiense]
MRRLAYGACVGLMFAIATLSAPAAAAHATRVSTDPSADAVLAAGPQRVSATFNEQLQTTFAAMTVVGPDGNVWSTGEPTVQGAVVGIALRALGPAGTYTVNYRVTSADGHVVSGSWSFRLTVPGTGTPGPPAAGPDGGGALPVWPFVAVAVALVAGGAWWAARRRR